MSTVTIVCYHDLYESRNLVIRKMISISRYIVAIGKIGKINQDFELKSFLILFRFDSLSPRSRKNIYFIKFRFNSRNGKEEISRDFGIYIGKYFIPFTRNKTAITSVPRIYFL